MVKPVDVLELVVGDWMSDGKLSICAPATRGVWVDLLCAMHKAGRSGELRGTTEQLARAARCSTAELDQALTELQTTGAADVTNRNGALVVVNRRMKREAEVRARDSERQRVKRQRDLLLRTDGAIDDILDDVTGLSHGGSGESNGDTPTLSISERRKLLLGVEEIPKPLATREFLGVWIEWLKHRRSIKISCEEPCLSRQLRDICPLGVVLAKECVELSLRNGWQGLFPERFVNGRNGSGGQANGRTSPQHQAATSKRRRAEPEDA